MKRKLLNISGKIDSATADLLRVVAEIVGTYGVEYLVVGATARDLVLRYWQPRSARSSWVETSDAGNIKRPDEDV